MINTKTSDRQFNDAFVLVAFNKIVYEISIQQSLDHPCNERSQDQRFPVVNPILKTTYQCNK